MNSPVLNRAVSAQASDSKLARLLAAALAVVMLPRLGARGTAAFAGVVFLAWAPVLPAWLRHAPEIRLRFATDPEVPTGVRWGGVEEPVTVLGSGTSERDGTTLRTLRLALQDGTHLDVSRPQAGGDWQIDRELGD